MHTTRRLDLLDPFEVAQLGGLEIVAKGVVEGYLNGLHRSPFRGFSVEFAEHRAYQAGDELRYVDWRMLARSDRLFVKQYEEETNLRAMVVVDASASMDWRGSEGRLTKLEYSKRLAAALTHILLKQRDAAGLIGFDETVREVVPARARRDQWWRMIRALENLTPGSGTAAEPALTRVTDLLRRRGLVVLISDLLFDRDLTLRALQFLRHRGHEVVVLHVMDPGEWDLEGPPEANYKDVETGVRMTVRPRELRAAYHDTVRHAVNAWQSHCRRNGIAYHHVLTDTPFGLVLRRAAGRGMFLA
ncbi:MAG: DUF58 domain-containing protein [Gemmatimonadota bacterium]|nr:DUF58 domain-containing protein [Gemmatimonadota bacterium]MDH5805267.1 DUF58 domain-containing protein [Gemmatimonadota bacterium]